MMRLIEGLPADVLGIEATGKVTHSDYRDVLIPRAEAMIGKGPIKMVYVIGSDVTGFELEAMWDDGMFGVKHWRDFSRVAVVTDHAWVRGAVSLFSPLFPSDVRLFAVADLPAAKTWVSRP
ncbi:MAG: STAS/SEC14 domain-containing protein [Gemmatimonadaceae bacterium]